MKFASTTPAFGHPSSGPKGSLRDSRGYNGYSLVEIIVSLGIVAVFFVLFQAAAGTTIINRNVKHQDIALRIAQTKIDALQALPYASLPASSAFSDPLLASLPAGSAVVSMADFNAKMKQATVTVYWQEPGGNTTHDVTLVTLIGEGGI